MKRLIPVPILFGLITVVASRPTSAQTTNAEKPPKQTRGPAVALDPQILKNVVIKDKRRGLRVEESDAYYHVLAYARKVDLRQLKAAARELQKNRRSAYPQLKRNPDRDFPTFVDLIRNPELYHGKPVALKGHVRHFVEQTAGNNEQDIKTLYEIWLYTDDSQTHPAIAVCTSIPETFPKGEDLIDHVRVTGYFFKLYLYDAQDGNLRFAPLILAHRLEWHPEEATTVLGPAPWAVYVGAVLVLGVIVLLLWRSARKDRAYHQSRLSRHSEATEPDFANLDAAGEKTTFDSAPTESIDVSPDEGTTAVDPGTAIDPRTDEAVGRPSS